MRESTRRKFDRLYQGSRRATLNRVYSGDPSDPDNTRRIIHEELYGRPATTKGTPGIWPLQFWYRQLRTKLRGRRK